METPRIEFPCPYPIKVIGEVQDSVSEIISVVRRHAPEVTPDEVSTRESRKGNFQSIRVTITATGETQLKALHAELIAVPGVRLVL
jgi:uncharacterized protein